MEYIRNCPIFQYGNLGRVEQESLVYQQIQYLVRKCRLISWNQYITSAINIQARSVKNATAASVPVHSQYLLHHKKRFENQFRSRNALKSSRRDDGQPLKCETELFWLDNYPLSKASGRTSLPKKCNSMELTHLTQLPTRLANISFELLHILSILDDLTQLQLGLSAHIWCQKHCVDIDSSPICQLRLGSNIPIGESYELCQCSSFFMGQVQQNQTYVPTLQLATLLIHQA